MKNFKKCNKTMWKLESTWKYTRSSYIWFLEESKTNQTVNWLTIACPLQNGNSQQDGDIDFLRIYMNFCIPHKFFLIPAELPYQSFKFWLSKILELGSSVALEIMRNFVHPEVNWFVLFLIEINCARKSK
jgi:hypothetical protein